MHTKKFKFGLTIFIAVLLTLGLSISLQSLLAAWTSPTSAPSNSNVSAPINVSSTAQIKAASIGIGVGLTSPNSLLHVYQTSGNNAEIDIQSIAGASNYWGIYQDRTTQDLRFWNNSAPGDKNVLTIKSNGNVGIGTTGPGEKLQIDDGNIKFFTKEDSGGSNWNHFIVFTDDADRVSGKMNIQRTSWGGAPHTMTFSVGNDAGPTEVMSLLHSGNVGIGTASPADNLHVHTGSNTRIRMTNTNTGSTGSDGFALGLGSSNIYIWNYETGLMIFGTSNSERMRIDSAGNVGIGTAAPGTNRLEVVGGPIKATGGLIIETRTSDPASPANGQIWLRTDL